MASATYRLTNMPEYDPRRKSALQPGLRPAAPGSASRGQQATGTGAAGASTPAPASSPTAPPTFTNSAQTNPDMQAALEAYRKRIEQQQGRETQTNPLLLEQAENLRKRMSADQTQRATERAGSQIRDFAAGQRSAADEASARMGRPQGFRGAAIDEAAQRNQAKAAADIQMGELDRQDRLVLGGSAIMGAPAQEALQREAGVTGQYGGLMGQAGAGAQLGLQQQQLGLSQWQTQQQMEMERQRLAQQQQAQQQQLLLEMMRNSGYY